jgi:hypothetical protein
VIERNRPSGFRLSCYAGVMLFLESALPPAVADLDTTDGSAA